MYDYVSIKSFSGKLPNGITDRRWYRCIEIMGSAENGYYFTIFDDFGENRGFNSRQSSKLNGGVWDVMLDCKEEKPTGEHIIYGKPIKDDEDMDVYDALAKAKHGDTVKQGSWSITKGKSGTLYDNNNDSLREHELVRRSWYIEPEKSTITIDNEKFKVNRKLSEQIKEQLYNN